MLIASENSNFVCMDVVNAEWIEARLTGKRGEKTRLAEAMGINIDKLSKIMRGERSVKATEIPGAMDYFGESLTGEAGEDRTKAIRLINNLAEETIPEALSYLEFLERKAAGDDKDR